MRGGISCCSVAVGCTHLSTPRLLLTWLQLSRCTGAIGRCRHGRSWIKDLGFDCKPWRILPVHLFYVLHACIMALALFRPVLVRLWSSDSPPPGVARRSYLLPLVVRIPFFLHSFLVLRHSFAPMPNCAWRSEHGPKE